MSSTELNSARKLFFGLLWVDMILTGIIGLNAFSTVGTLREVEAGLIEVDQSMLDGFEFWGNLAKLTLLTMIAVGIGLVKWLNACYAYARSVIGVSGLKQEGWTTWSWLVPFLNLFKPYQVISELYKVGGTGYSTPEGWRQETGSGALLAWWIFWVIMHIVMWQMFRVMMWGSPNIHNAIMSTQLQAWSCFGSLLVAGLWFWIGSWLTQRLQERRCLSADSFQPPIRTQSPSPDPAPIWPAPTRGTPPTSRATSNVAMPTNTASSQPKNLHSIPNIDEDVIYEIVGKEIQEGRTETGLWTRLFAEMNGDETKVKVAYIKRRAEKLIASEQARIQEQLRVQEEGQKAARIVELELQALAKAAGVTIEQAKEMLWFGITREGNKFLFEEYRYDRIEDAVNYAETRYGRLR